MSTASRTVEVKFTPKAGTYTTMIQSPSGDLYQEYSGESGSIGAVTPDFSTLKPLLVFIATSSRVAEGVAVPTSVEWYFNGVKLAFNNNVSTTAINGETGHFQFVPYVAGSQDYFGLRIIKNLVNAAGLAPCTVKAAAKVAYGNRTDTLKAEYVINIGRSTGSPYKITIASDDDKYFTIREKGGSCRIKAVAYQGGAEISSALTYKWYKLTAGTWKPMTGYTGRSVTITGDMTDCFSQFKAEVYQSGALLGSDVQGVMDVSDPYDIIANPEPADMTIENEGDNVVFTPFVVKRGTTVKAFDTKFRFTFTDSVGIILNAGQSTVPAYTGTVTYAMCEQANSDVNVTIETEN